MQIFVTIDYLKKYLKGLEQSSFHWDLSHLQAKPASSIKTPQAQLNLKFVIKPKAPEW